MFPEILKKFRKVHLERLCDFFQDLIIVHHPKANVFVVARINTRREVLSCFPQTSDESLEAWHYNSALSEMPLIKGTSLFYHFRYSLGPWYVGFSLISGVTCDQVKQWLELRQLEKSPREKYGLIKRASDLLSWLLSENYENFDLHLSPDVEGDLKLRIGINMDEIGERNLHQSFDLLCKEITEKPSSRRGQFLGPTSFTIPQSTCSFARKSQLRSELFEQFNLFFGSAARTELEPRFRKR